MEPGRSGGQTPHNHLELKLGELDIRIAPSPGSKPADDGLFANLLSATAQQEDAPAAGQPRGSADMEKRLCANEALARTTATLLLSMLSEIATIASANAKAGSSSPVLSAVSLIPSSQSDETITQRQSSAQPSNGSIPDLDVRADPTNLDTGIGILPPLSTSKNQTAVQPLCVYDSSPNVTATPRSPPNDVEDCADNSLDVENAEHDSSGRETFAESLKKISQRVAPPPPSSVVVAEKQENSKVEAESTSQHPVPAAPPEGPQPASRQPWWRRHWQYALNVLNPGSPQKFGAVVPSQAAPERRRSVLAPTKPVGQQPTRAWCIVSGEGHHRQTWDAMMLALVLYTICESPFEFSFLDRDQPDDAHLSARRILIAIDLSMNALFFMDIFLNCVTTFMSGETEIDDARETAYRYLTSPWFVIDFVSSLPVSAINTSQVGQRTWMLKAAKLFRLLKVSRISGKMFVPQADLILLCVSSGDFSFLYSEPQLLNHLHPPFQVGVSSR